MTGVDLRHRGLILDRRPSLTGDAATAVFSPDRTYRYSLTRRWDNTAPLACFIMVNPSTADALTDDPTIRRCCSFARSWGAGGLLVVNLFALRATNPDELRRHPDPVGPDNDYAIRYLLSANPYRPPGWVVAAWGVHGLLDGRDEQVFALVADTPAAGLQCLGTTRDGQPRHPLYVRGGTPLAAFPEAACPTRAGTVAGSLKGSGKPATAEVRVPAAADARGTAGTRHTSRGAPC
jgi:hypothetical protein